jgi:hypothetical protein
LSISLNRFSYQIKENSILYIFIIYVKCITIPLVIIKAKERYNRFTIPKDPIGMKHDAEAHILLASIANTIVRITKRFQFILYFEG